MLPERFVPVATPATRVLLGAKNVQDPNHVQEFWPIMIAGYKLWPIVSVANFTVVPVERRVLVGSIVGLGWGVFMALRITPEA